MGAYFAVVAIGFIVGATELMSRYKDAPLKVFLSWSAWVFLALNMIASATALLLIDVFGAKLFDNLEGDIQKAFGRVLLAGFGAMAFLRSSVFRFRIDQTDVPVGPSVVLDILTRIFDREVDRSRAIDRALRSPAIMKSVPATVACGELPLVCIALMQNLTADEQQSLGKQIALIRDDKVLSDAGKSLIAGLTLTNFVGVKVLDEAVRSILARSGEGSFDAEPNNNEAAGEILRDLHEDRKAHQAQAERSTPP
ncbi:MAG TPA: hypothetical protein VF744_08230 [Beijerinckiaceae bacterium]|jgi:hypothetical protein